jgi:hypothetical protein
MVGGPGEVFSFFSKTSPLVTSNKNKTTLHKFHPKKRRLHSETGNTDGGETKISGKSFLPKLEANKYVRLRRAEGPAWWLF